MSDIGLLVERLVAKGLTVAEAGSIIAEAVAAGVSMAPKRSSNAEKCARYRNRKRVEKVSNDTSDTVSDQGVVGVEMVSNDTNDTSEILSLSPPSPPKEVSPYNPLQEITPSTSPISNSRPSVASDFPADGFEQFWRTYPRREAKQACKKKYDVLRKNGQVPFAKLLSGARRYAEHHRGTDPQYIKQPLTWLNQGCWDDELPAKREQGGFRWNGIEGVI